MRDEPISGRAEPAEKLRTLQDESFSPRVLEFAHFLADRMDSPGEVVPRGLIMCSTLAIYDLENGVDGYTNEPINNSLVGLQKPEYDELLRHVPHLARVAFSADFADEVQNFMIEKDLIPAPEASIAPTIEKGEIITDVITDIGDAKTQIIDDAKRRLLDLDWDKLDIDTSGISDLFDLAYPLMLRNAPYHLPITLLRESDPTENYYLENMPDSHKMRYGERYWLALTGPAIEPEAAMATRDHLFIKGIDVVVGNSKKDPEKSLAVLSQDMHGPVRRSAIRLYAFIQDHPELSR